MSHPILFPKKSFFYPIGNTSAVCLTKDLPPEESGNLLLIGCGDPRNILYTIYATGPVFPRKLDFTCCDIEPAVLARNVILLTMLADNQNEAQIWNIFFHIRLDKPSLSLLVKHCQILIEASENLDKWQESKYATFLKFCTSRTLSELRRRWLLYVGMEELSSLRKQKIRKAFEAAEKSAIEKGSNNLTASRSAGPLWHLAAQVVPDYFRHYWNTGITSIDPKQVAGATFFNPTFAYSLAGEGCSVHYGTDPLLPFHLAPIFASAGPSSKLTISQVVAGAKEQFRNWCGAFKASIIPGSPLCVVVRMFAGEAISFCRALQYCSTNNSTITPAITAPWTAVPIEFDRRGYADGEAPLKFNVIDTSNMTDHVGLLNVLIGAVPLLSRTPSSALYTEALLPSGEDATKGFRERLCADISTMSFVLGLALIARASHFTTYSNTSSVFMTRMLEDGERCQFHEHITWKYAALGDTIAVRHDSELIRAPKFDKAQLAKFLFSIYLKMFSDEDVGAMMKNISIRTVQERSLINYIRETFVMFLKLVKDRVDVDWDGFMEEFFTLLDAETSRPMDANNYQDLCCQLRRNDVYTVEKLSMPVPKVGRFERWPKVPILVCVILTVPREKLKVLEEMDPDKLGTPILHCDTRGSISHNIFSSIQTAFGEVRATGSDAKPEIAFEEDPAGWSGTSSLVVSFWIPAWNIAREPHDLHVRLSVRSTPMTVMTVVPKLGWEMVIFSANCMNRKYVNILPEQPNLSAHPNRPFQNPLSMVAKQMIGRTSVVAVVFDDTGLKVKTLGVRVNVEDSEAKSTFSGGASVKIEQISPCVMSVSFGAFSQEVGFPFPIIGSRAKLRLARQSLYIEVLVPISGPFLPGGFSINPFPVVLQEKRLSAWNIHYVNPVRLPIVDTTNPKNIDWIGTHMGAALSDRERALRDKDIRTDVLMNIKDTLHSIFVKASGIDGQKRRVFTLVNTKKKPENVDTLIFVNDLRLDVASHTIIADGYVLPLKDSIMPTVAPVLSSLYSEFANIPIFGEELKAWKQILPAFTERCRQWEHTSNCEYLRYGSVPLTTEMNENPLCTCGTGKDVDAFMKVKEWRKLAPFVTRIALGPLFAVSYLEKVAGKLKFKHNVSQESSKSASGQKLCAVCKGPGKPKLLVCTKCKNIMYCSAVCQRSDWKTHKVQCVTT